MSGADEEHSDNHTAFARTLIEGDRVLCEKLEHSQILSSNAALFLSSWSRGTVAVKVISTDLAPRLGSLVVFGGGDGQHLLAPAGAGREQARKRDSSVIQSCRGL